MNTLIETGIVFFFQAIDIEVHLTAKSFAGHILSIFSNCIPACYREDPVAVAQNPSHVSEF
jgi:hypothetical protein